MSMKFTIAAATLASAAAGTGVCVDENCSCADVGADGHLNTGPLTELKDNQFKNCAELTSVDMPEVTSTGIRSFLDCRNLVTANIPKVELIKVDTFRRNYKLTTAEMPEVTLIKGNAFSGTALTTVYLPKVEKIEQSVFYECPNLTSVDMPVTTEIGWTAFSRSYKLTTVSMPELTKVGHMAFARTGLTTANMPKVTNLAVNHIGGVFQNCPDLTTVNIPEVTKTGRGTFRDCPKLTTVNMPKVTKIEFQAFLDCTALTTIDMPEATTIENSAFRRSALTAAYAPKATSIGHDSFPAGTVMANAPTNNASLLDVDECDKTTCSLVENSAGYTVIQVIHPANNDFETVCNDGQDYSKGAQNVAHTTAITKHCAMVGAECKCYKAGSHPNGAVPADVATAPAGWSGSSGTGTATSMDHSGRAGIEAALAAHEAINKVTETDTAAANAIKVAAHTRDGTDYAAHDGHVN